MVLIVCSDKSSGVNSLAYAISFALLFDLQSVELWFHLSLTMCMLFFPRLKISLYRSSNPNLE